MYDLAFNTALDAYSAGTTTTSREKLISSTFGGNAGTKRH